MPFNANRKANGVVVHVGLYYIDMPTHAIFSWELYGINGFLINKKKNTL